MLNAEPVSGDLGDRSELERALALSGLVGGSPKVHLEQSQIDEYYPAKQLPCDIHVICTVCMESVGLGELCRELRCGHVFHKECVDPWLTGESCGHQSTNTCPNCRAVVECTPAPVREEKPLAQWKPIKQKDLVVRFPSRKTRSATKSTRVFSERNAITAMVGESRWGL